MPPKPDTAARVAAWRWFGRNWPPVVYPSKVGKVAQWARADWLANGVLAQANRL